MSHSVELAVKDGVFVLGYIIQANSALLALEPISETVAKIRGLDRNRSGAVWAIKINGKEQIQLWGNYYKKLLFT